MDLSEYFLYALYLQLVTLFSVFVFKILMMFVSDSEEEKD